VSNKTRISAKLKAEITKRADSRCEYCLCSMLFSSSPYSVEHIIPSVKGGSNRLENLALSCMGCNGAKYTSTTGADPVSGNVVALFHPRTDVWQEHFAWSHDGLQVIGTTPTGRATVAILALNREGVVNLRRLLAEAGAHPSASMREEDRREKQ